jgi:electron transport complex protein RnfB
MLAAILSLGGIGLVAAVALGFAAKKFAVEVDPRELAILEVLPNVNCGACGYPGCAGFA